MGRKCVHCRFWALDITIDSVGNPILIEYNCHSFGFWVMMFVEQNPLGNYTDEVIEYCKSKIKNGY